MYFLSLVDQPCFTRPDAYREQAIYSVTEGLQINEVAIPQHRLAVLTLGTAVKVSADRAARGLAVGGEPIGVRHKWWNFVSSRLERIEQAKQDWREGRFATVPQETEFIPLPKETTRPKEKPM